MILVHIVLHFVELLNEHEKSMLDLLELVYFSLESVATGELEGREYHLFGTRESVWCFYAAVANDDWTEDFPGWQLPDVQELLEQIGGIEVFERSLRDLRSQIEVSFVNDPFVFDLPVHEHREFYH